jgi:hypothetical protein
LVRVLAIPLSIHFVLMGSLGLGGVPFRPTMELVGANLFQSLSNPTKSICYKPSHPPVAKLILVVGLGWSAMNLFTHKLIAIADTSTLMRLPVTSRPECDFGLAGAQRELAPFQLALALVTLLPRYRHQATHPRILPHSSYERTIVYLSYPIAHGYICSQ